jgi:archaellum component FlaF (FlaF/FlaG flagellin family)
MAFFVEAVDDANRARYEVVYEDEATGVEVTPVFVATGA